MVGWLFLSFIVLSVPIASLLFQSGVLGQLMVVGLVLLVVVRVVRSTVTQAESKVKSAQKYFRMLSENEARMPGFGEFFKEFLAAKQSRSTDLRAKTLPLFENGPAHHAG